ncbi:aldose 1-epimerase [Glaciibacter superstes]|uniref:aldose epimerase family protein n=1 Tax=Glaciibacter superstes TaxID=501023 RepID=UPI0003B45502|nr:aldose 1-epimerase [Glaciibacter superstes]
MYNLTARAAGQIGSAVRAVVSVRGASLRALTVDGVDLIRSTFDTSPPLAAGVVLVPWPNRVDGATWRLGEQHLGLEVTEPSAGNAIHGLLAGHDYELVEIDDSSLTLSAAIVGHAGYPFELSTQIRYELTSNGIAVAHRIRNESTTPAPVALGVHPYLRVGEWPVEELRLFLPAATILPLDDRHFATSRRAVRGVSETLQDGPHLSEIVQHACFSDIALSNGELRADLIAPNGDGVRLWAEPDFGYVQLYVTPDFPTDAGRCTAVAIEPMTAPPNALQSGVDLRWLVPGESWVLRWGIQGLGSLAPH